MRRYYYADTIDDFLTKSTAEIVDELVRANEFSLEQTQRDSWFVEMEILRKSLHGIDGHIYLEFTIPRMGKRIDAVVLAGPVVFVIEFKVGESTFPRHAIDQVWDYALDLKYFHESSREKVIAPILLATQASKVPKEHECGVIADGVLSPRFCNADTLRSTMVSILSQEHGQRIDALEWQAGGYHPTPTIVEAAMSLYRGHAVEEISRSDASAINLAETSSAISRIIEYSRSRFRKSICFVTGVPGAGKTLVGLDIATKHMDADSELYSVFLSGNGPLVAILREALVRDKVRADSDQGLKTRKGEARSKVKAFVQNVHHFRDECIRDAGAPPEHVVLFDEAQRAWNQEQTANFMARKKGQQEFSQSEPEFLISCMDRHQDWAVIVCLVGGGQEINTGEAGIREWLEAIDRSFPHWDVYVSEELHDSEYDAEDCLRKLSLRKRLQHRSEMHLSVSMRSFRAEKVSLLVKQVLDQKVSDARTTLASIGHRYPIALTCDLASAKHWIRQRARGSERYGIVVSSQAERLKPHAIDVRSPVDPIHWFLNGKDDVRSSYYMEDVATEFHVQGLELDWVCVVWDADFRYSDSGWRHHAFRGNAWQVIRKEERQRYLKNAYRVLLTRARQGMIIVVPRGDDDDPTRLPEYYDATFNYLQEIGLDIV